MSIFNVGTGREPAEIGVAEYQKPDYQQFEKLANINMQLKQAELEKAQAKTKDWEDILTKDYTTEYAIEKSQFMDKKMGDIKDQILKDWSKNPALANDNAYMFKIKSLINQVGGWGKVFDAQHKNILETRTRVEGDTKGIAYDKAYATDYLKAIDDPEDFYSKNKDGEVGKLIEGIMNTPQVQGVKDKGERRAVIRSAMQATPLKKGTINIPLKTDGKPEKDISRAYADKSGKRTTYDEVSPVSALVFTMNAHRNGSNENIPYREYTKRKLMEQTGESGYGDYLSKLKDDYVNNYNAMAKEYAGEEITMGKFNELPKPENLTEGDLLDYAWGKPESANFTTKTARESQTTNVSVRTGDGNKVKTTSGTTNTRVKIPSVGGFSQTDVTTTVIDPRDQSKTVQFNNIYIIKENGHLERLENSTTTVGITAPMKQIQTALIPVYKNKYYTTPDGLDINATLSESERQDMIKNPSKYKDKVVFMTAFSPTSITTQAGSKKTDSAIAFAKYDQNALNIIQTEAEEQGYTGFYPTEAEYSFDEGLKYYNEHKKIKAPKRPIKR